MTKHALTVVTCAWLVAEHAWVIWRVPSATAYLLGTGLFAMGAVALRAWALAVMALFFALRELLAAHLPGEIWQIPGAALGVSFLGTVLLAAPLAPGRSALAWLRWGTPDRMAWVLSAVTSLLAAVALLVWAYWTDHLGFGVQMMRPMAELAPALVIGLIIPGFAVLNACAEELVYRGLVQQAVETALPAPAAWLAQASVFAALHVAGGFPNGAMGYIMVLVWGTMLGYLRHRTGGMLVPTLVHIAADLVIFYTLYALV